MGDLEFGDDNYAQEQMERKLATPVIHPQESMVPTAPPMTGMRASNFHFSVRPRESMVPTAPPMAGMSASNFHSSPPEIYVPPREMKTPSAPPMDLMSSQEGSTPSVSEATGLCDLSGAFLKMQTETAEQTSQLRTAAMDKKNAASKKREAAGRRKKGNL